jgi:ABC-type branched-subunit amino acid transport system permease subunit
MTRALSLILGLLMLVQLIYPLGLPGLKRRADAWKIAVLALALILAIATLRPPHTEAALPIGWTAAGTDHVT